MSARIPRLALGDLDPELAAALAPRVERLGYLGEFFRCAGHQPGALKGFVTLTEELRRALPDDLTEVVALAVTTRLGNVYEQNQHERLCLKLGFAPEWIRAACRGAERAAAQAVPDPGATLSADQRVVRELALAVVERSGHGVGAELEAAIDAIGAAQSIAVLLLIGRYVTHSLVVNALGLEPPVGSPLAPADGGGE